MKETKETKWRYEGDDMLGQHTHNYNTEYNHSLITTTTTTTTTTPYDRVGHSLSYLKSRVKVGHRI